MLLAFPMAAKSDPLMDLPAAVQRFFDIPSDIDLDRSLSDSITESSSSPHLMPSDDLFLNPEYWYSHPDEYARLKQCFLPYKLPRRSSKFALDWVDGL